MSFIRLPEPNYLKPDKNTGAIPASDLKNYINQLLKVLKDNFDSLDNRLVDFENTHTRIVTAAFDGGGVALVVGSTTWIRVPFSGIIVSCSILTDVVGDLTVDIWKDVYANYPPTDADSITAGNEPSITGDDQFIDTTLTGWTVSVNKGDVLMFNIDACNTITNAIVSLEIKQT